MSYSSSDPPIYSPPSPELKLYQAFIFSVPIFFTFILLLLFYVFYLRWRRVDWASLQMRSSYQTRGIISGPSESGLKKEVREMLPIFIFKESFLIKETQAVKHSYCRCSVCLGDYQANEKLQQIPCCGHTFHMLCIDSWLAAHSTCPLCRVSLFPPAKDAVATPHPQQDEGMTERDRENAGLQEDSHREYEPDFADSSCDVGQGICDEARRDEECEDVAEGSAVVVAVETRTRVETLPSLDHAEV